jgi:YD repeat-containing protein
MDPRDHHARLTSVIVPCRGGVQFPGRCVRALGRHTRPPWELVAVVDGPEGGAAAYLAGVADAAPFPVGVVAAPPGAGPGAALAAGLAVARGDPLVLLDPACVVADGWLDQLLALAGSDPMIGLAGPMSDGAPPPQRAEAPGRLDLAGLGAFAARWRDERRGTWFVADGLWPGCLLVRRAVLESAGHLAEAADADDLARRLARGARRAGYRAAVAHDCDVHAGPLPQAEEASPAGPAARVELLSRAAFARLFGAPDPSRALCGYTPPADTHAVLALLAHARPRRVLEVGTALGHMTANLTEWSPDDATVISIGLARGMAGTGTPEQEVEAPDAADLGRLAGHFGKGHKVRLHVGDSLRFDFASVAPLDFAFIDGGHDLEHALSDSRGAYAALAPGGWLIWHDFGSDVPWVKVREAIDRLAPAETVHHIEGTRVAFLRKGPSAARPASGRPLRLAGEGDVDGLHSLAIVNRALCRELAARGHDLGVVPPPGPPPTPDRLPPDPLLAGRVGGSAPVVAGATIATSEAGTGTASAPAGGDAGAADPDGTRDGGEGTAADWSYDDAWSYDAVPLMLPPEGPDLGLFDVDGGGGGVAMAQFTNFSLYTLDYTDGVVLFPGYAGMVTPSASEDLRAQVRDDVAATYTYSWDTSGLTQAYNISATNTYRLQFQWTPSATGPATNTVTLTVTQSGTGLQEVQTYTFLTPASPPTAATTVVPTWPGAIGPDLALPGGAAFDAHAVSVVALSGAVNTSIGLPAYSPNLAPWALEYDSLAADARPMVVVHHPLDAALAVPTKTSVRLTFDGTDGSTYFYDTAKFIAGDVARFAVQVDATAKATGRYAYSVRVVDDRAGALTTTTYSGTLSLVNEKDSAFGAGWTLRGLNRIHSATGGVILNVGKGESLWFTAGSSSGGTTPYTSPAGDFSTLTKTDATGVYARTLKDGTKQHFDANGYQTAVEDRNGLRVTFTYDGSNRLQTILDPYSQRTTFAYDGNGKLDTITDPAGRVTDLTVASGNLTSALLADNARLTFSYDASKRMTAVTDPNSRMTTVAYDAAGRADVVTRPDLSTQSFDPYQVRGYDTSGTSGSPAPATLLAEARASSVDPRGNAWDLRPDWRGMGLVNQPTDPLGKVATSNRDAAGLATVVVDRLNRISRAKYDAKGNVVTWTYADGNKEQFLYNGFAQVTTYINPRDKYTTLTYDAEGNLTEIRDPLSNRTTFTYTANGRVATAKDPRSNVTTYQYDSQDRLTTITYPAVGGSSATTRLAYDAKGNVATLTDERGNSTTYAYDALNRPTGQKDALGNRTTITYDSGGNSTVVALPTPSGQTARTTTYAYDAMNRVTTITAPLSRVSKVAYDSGGNATKLTDPLSRVTTLVYDALNRRTVTIDPLSGRTTVTYDAEGQALTVKDPLGNATTYTYTSRGQLYTMVDPLGTTTTYAYTASGRPDTVRNPAWLGGVVMAYTYDDADRLIQTADGLNKLTTTVYDSGGNVVARVDPRSKRTTFTYDARNRLETVKDPLSNVTTFVLDEAGNRTVVVDPNSKRTTTAYDALDRATTLTDARNGVTVIVFDKAGRNTVVVDPVSNRTTFAYDAADRMTTMTDALGTVTQAYDLADQLTGRTDRLGRSVTFAYDSGGRRINEWWVNSGGTVARRITMTYDAAGRMTGVNDPDATLTFTYDSGGRLTAAGTSGGGTGQPAVTLTYGHDQAHARTSVTDNLSSVGRTTYAYDGARRLTTITRSVGGTQGPWVKFAHDDAHRRTATERSVGGTGLKVATTFSYDNADRVTTITHRAVTASGGTTMLATFAYGYDSGGRLTTENNAEGLATYSYDDTNQLTGVDKPGTSSDESFGYDLNGNRDTTGYTTTTGNRMTAAPGYTFGYDAEGNMTTRTQLNGAGTADDVVTTFAYDHRNRLTGATSTVNGSVTMRATYAYDPVDRRIKTEVDLDGAGAGAATVTWTTYDGLNAYADFDGAGAVVKRYLFALAVDELLTRTDANGSNADWYGTDRLGSVRDVFDAATAAPEWHAGYCQMLWTGSRVRRRPSPRSHPRTLLPGSRPEGGLSR